MLKLGVNCHEQDEAAATALAEAVSMHTAAWNYIYVHMLAAALRYMLPAMHRIPREAKPGEIVREGWNLVTTIRKTKEHTSFRELLQDKLKGDKQNILTSDQWRATARLAAIFVIFMTLIQRIKDDSFTHDQRVDFLRRIFKNLVDLPWYLPPRLLDIEPRLAESVTLIFKEVAYQPQKTSSKRRYEGRLNCTTARKNLKTAYKLLKLYDWMNVRYTPADFFARIWTVSKIKGADDLYLPTLLLQFQEENNMGEASTTTTVQPGVRQPPDEQQAKQPSDDDGTMAPERAKNSRLIERATLDWPLEFTDESCTQLRSPRDGNPPHLPGYTVLQGSAARWRARNLNAALRTAAADPPDATVAGPAQVNKETMDSSVPPLPGILHYDSVFQDGYDMNDMGQDFALTDPIPDNIFDEGLKFSFELM